MELILSIAFMAFVILCWTVEDIFTSERRNKSENPPCRCSAAEINHRARVERRATGLNKPK